MKKLLKAALAGVMAISLVGCGGKESESGSSSKGLTEWHTYQTAANEMETWDVFHSQGAAELNVLTNLIDSMLTNDTDGKLVKNMATSWESNDDKTVWTFHLAEGVKWVNYKGEEMGDVTSADFVTGLEHCLNYEANEGANSSMPREMIKGAEEYYNLTKETPEEASIEKFLEMVGIETPDEHTVVYTMFAPKPYFDTLATYSPLYPLAQGCLDAYGEDYGTNNENIWYCGPYICTEHVDKNHKTLEANPTYWNKDNVKVFDKVTIAMVEDVQLAWQLFQSGEIDAITLSEDMLKEITAQGEGSEWYKYLVETLPAKYAYVMRYNYNKKLEDGSDDVNWNTAIANENFRKAIYYGVEWTEFLKRTNSINPGKCINDTMTMKGLVFKTDGTEYSQLVHEKLGYTSELNSDSVHARLDATKAAEYKEAAIKELTAAGVTLPVTLVYTYMSGNATAADTAKVFQQMMEEQLPELIKVEFKTYSSSYSQEIRIPELFSVQISGWGADYGDPINYLGQDADGDNAFYNANYSNLTAEIDPEFQTYCDMVHEADEITDLDERFEKFAAAEAFYVEHAWSLPLYYNIAWEITRVNDYSKIQGVYGMQAGRYVNWETTSNVAYTTEEYAAFAK